MRQLLVILCFVSLAGTSVQTAEANDGLFRRRAARKCCVVQSCCVVRTYRVVKTVPDVRCPPVTCGVAVQSAPVVAYRPTSSTCAQCDAATANLAQASSTMVNGNLNSSAANLGTPTPATMSTSASSSGMSHQQVLDRINTYLDLNDISICSLKSRIPEYGAIIKSLTDRSQRYSVDGVSLCYPSLEYWNSHPEVQANITRILSQNGIL